MVLNVNSNGNDENGGNSIKLKQPTAELFFFKKKKKIGFGVWVQNCEGFYFVVFK